MPYCHLQEYIVRDGEVMIVDSFSGRVLEGRRYSDGLHQCIEAKEGDFGQNYNEWQATALFACACDNSALNATTLNSQGQNVRVRCNTRNDVKQGDSDTRADRTQGTNKYTASPITS